MRSNTLPNQSIFRTYGGSTNSLSSAMMICHPLAKGDYSGTVFHNGRMAGHFTIHCSDNEEATQADVDLSTFINAATGNCDCHTSDKSFNLNAGGYVVLYSSGGESGFHAEISGSDKTSYTTQKPERGDIVISMLLRPGSYEVTGGKQKMDLSVEEPKDYKNYQEILSSANTVSLSEKGFSNTSMRSIPGQGLVIKLETGGPVTVKLVKATPIKPVRTATRRWVKPSTPVYTRKKK